MRDGGGQGEGGAYVVYGTHQFVHGEFVPWRCCIIEASVASFVSNYAMGMPYSMCPTGHVSRQHLQ